MAADHEQPLTVTHRDVCRSNNRVATIQNNVPALFYGLSRIFNAGNAEQDLNYIR